MRRSCAASTGCRPWSAPVVPRRRSAPVRRSASTAPREPSPCWRVSSTGYTRSLDQLRRGDEPSFGGKSASLGELLAAEIPVPPGFALSTAAYSAFVADDAVAAAIADGAAPAIADAMRA